MKNEKPSRAAAFTSWAFSVLIVAFAAMILVAPFRTATLTDEIEGFAALAILGVWAVVDHLKDNRGTDR
jgi:hypothetical protein